MNQQGALLLASGAVVLGAFASAAEVSLFSLRRIEREQIARGESWADRRLIELAAQPRRCMTSLRLAALLGAGLLWLGCYWALGQTISWPFSWPRATSQPLIVPDPARVLIAVALAALVKVCLSDMVPKAVAAKASLRWARRLIGPAVTWSALTLPVAASVQWLTDLILRPWGEHVRPKLARDMTEDEFKHLIAEAGHGQVAASERRLIDRVFQFADKNVGQIMTPRDRVFALAYDVPMARLQREVASRGFSRVPIYQKNLDNVRGVLNAKDLLRAPGKALSDLLHEPLFIPRTTPVKRLFLQFKQKKSHFAIVVNEYGGVLGVVTMDDVLAQLFGAIRDERESIQAIPRRVRMERTPPSGVQQGQHESMTPVPSQEGAAAEDPASVAAPSTPDVAKESETP